MGHLGSWSQIGYPDVLLAHSGVILGHILVIFCHPGSSYGNLGSNWDSKSTYSNKSIN